MPVATDQLESLRAVVTSPPATDAAARERFQVDGLTPAAVVEPETPEEMAAIVGWARAERAALVPVGSGYLLGLGGIPERIDVAVSIARLDSVLHYDPGDLTIAVGAGMSLERVQATLGEHNQFLPVNPPAAAEVRIGGLLATNLSGPWRYAYGSWRDFVLGLRFVTGTGKRVRTGGRVVKNVAGYDLSKLLIGSLGTLGIIVEVNFKAFPRPEQRVTWVAGFREFKGALALRSAIVHSPTQPLAIELVDEPAARLLGISETLPKARCWIVVEGGGTTKVLDRYESELSQRAAQAGAAEIAQLRETAAQTLWSRICDFGCRVCRASPGATVVKASLLLTQMEFFLEQAHEIASRHHLSTATCARAGSGIIYFALLAESEEQENIERVRQAATEMMQQGTSLGGRVTLEWAPTPIKRVVNVWGGTRDDFTLMQKLKAEFDPHRVLNPGRFLGGL